MIHKTFRERQPSKVVSIFIKYHNTPLQQPLHVCTQIENKITAIILGIVSPYMLCVIAFEFR